MKKSKLKILVLPIAVASASVIGMVSGTLAYFTSMDKATVSIEAGQVKIDMNFDADSLKLYSLDVERDALIFENGGTASLGEGNVLSLDKITPGDKVTFNVKLTNSSNVDAKYVLLADFADEVEGKNRTDAGKVVPHAGDTITGTKVLSEGLVVKDGENDLTSGIAFVALEASQVITKTITVELPKEAGNEYQGAQSKIVFKVIALQKNAPMTPELYLEIANAHTKKHAHPTAAIEKLSADGMDFLAELETGGILEDYAFFWNQADGDFYSGSPASVAEWKFVDAVSGIGTSYSSYLLGDSLTGDIVTAAGIDVGENSSINSVSYIRTTGEAQEVAIRTNSLSTTVTVNAPNDVVKHYGNAGSLNIIAVAGSSYHEYGKVAFAEISKGRIALEAGADVTQLHISSIKENEVTTNHFDEIIVSIDENVTKPKFSRDDVAIDDNGTLVVAIQEGTEAVTDATDLDYVWLTKQGIYEQIKVSDNNQSTADAKWADDASLDNTNTQEAAYDIANNIGRNTTTNKVEDTVTTVENETYDVSLDEETRDLVVKQNDQVVENQETVAEVIGESVDKTGLTEDQKEAAKEDIVNTSKYADYIAAGFNFVVGGEGYVTLKDAFDNVEDNQTVTLLQDVNFVISAEDVNQESFNYWQGQGFSVGYKMYSYIHLNNKKGIVFDLNGHSLTADYSFNIIDYFPSGYSYAAKSFIYLSGDGSLDIKNGSMDIKFDYKNRAATATGSSVYSTGKYAAIYVHNSPDNPGKSSQTATYDIPYQSKLSMVNCSLKANQIPLYLGHGAYVTELNANLEYHVGSVEETAVGKGANIYEMNIQNSDGYCALYVDSGSKVDKITGGSYIAYDQRVLDRNTGKTTMGFFGNGLYSLRVSDVVNPSTQYYPNVHLPKGEIGEISGGQFKATSSNGPVNYIWGYIGKISGGLFAYYEGTWVNRNNQYINPPLKFYSTSCIDHICGGTFVSGCSKSRPDNPLINLVWFQSPSSFPDLSTIVDEGYEVVANHSADETFDCGGSVGEITFYGYTVQAA